MDQCNLKTGTVEEEAVAVFWMEQLTLQTVCGMHVEWFSTSRVLTPLRYDMLDAYYISQVINIFTDLPLNLSVSS